MMKITLEIYVFMIKKSLTNYIIDGTEFDTSVYDKNVNTFL